ncbi:hypothetical protein JXA63_01260 [Candidatus Woesebacteria bacterium]|nr:hypothetical protein [Candidatus Woesebacteria bacterium]
MGKQSQLWLPKLTEFARGLETYPQPHLDKLRTPKKYEILYHPLDLRFRGRMGKWIEYLSSLQKIRLKETLTELELKLVLLYFYPQGKFDRWLNQEEVAKKLPEVKYWSFRSKAVGILEKIWEDSRKD